MSDTAVMTLTEFLTARLDEDEEFAKHAMAGDIDHLPSIVTESGDFYLGGNAARVLAEVVAKRRIVNLHHEYLRVCTHCVDWRGAHERESWPCETVRALASVYSDHPDYDPSWS